MKNKRESELEELRDNAIASIAERITYDCPICGNVYDLHTNAIECIQHHSLEVLREYFGDNSN